MPRVSSREVERAAAATTAPSVAAVCGLWAIKSRPPDTDLHASHFSLILHTCTAGPDSTVFGILQ